MNINTLQAVANEVRKNIVTAVYFAKSGHPGGSLSAAEIYTYLYMQEMNVDPANPGDPDRDRFVLSKGHACPGLYSAMAERGYFDKEELKTFRHLGTRLQGHPSMHYTYTLLGDGELEEGQVWEAAMFAGAKKLDNLCVIVDNNNLQIDGTIADVNDPYPIDLKFEAFNFHVINVADGHDFGQLEAAFAEARETKGRPSVIICKTVKGKGVSFMENQVGWHGSAPNQQQYETAMEELERKGETA